MPTQKAELPMIRALIEGNQQSANALAEGLQEINTMMVQLRESVDRAADAEIAKLILESGGNQTIIHGVCQTITAYSAAARGIQRLCAELLALAEKYHDAADRIVRNNPGFPGLAALLKAQPEPVPPKQPEAIEPPPRAA